MHSPVLGIVVAAYAFVAFIEKAIPKVNLHHARSPRTPSVWPAPCSSPQICPINTKSLTNIVFFHRLTGDHSCSNSPTFCYRPGMPKRISGCSISAHLPISMLRECHLKEFSQAESVQLKRSSKTSNSKNVADALPIRQPRCLYFAGDHPAIAAAHFQTGVQHRPCVCGGCPP